MWSAKDYSCAMHCALFYARRSAFCLVVVHVVYMCNSRELHVYTT